MTGGAFSETKMRLYYYPKTSKLDYTVRTDMGMLVMKIESRTQECMIILYRAYKLRILYYMGGKNF